MFSSKQSRFGLCVLWVVVLAVVCVALSGCSEKKPKAYRIGILSGLDYMSGAIGGFKAKMTELGYREGENVIYDVQRTNFDMDMYKKILKQFVADRVDLIFSFPTEASLEAKQATQGTNIPVVFCIANIEDTGLVDSVRQPGGNITGVRYPGPDLAIKRFEIMRELVPQAKRMWVPYQRGYPIVKSQLEVLRSAARDTGITLIEAPASDAAELKTILDAKTQSGDIGMDAILFIAEPLAVTPDAFAVMGKFAEEHKVPVGGALMVVGQYESLFGINIDPAHTGGQAATLADKVLRGMRAGAIPVISSESYFEINYKAIKELGLEVSEGLLGRANRIIR